MPANESVKQEVDDDLHDAERQLVARWPAALAFIVIGAIYLIVSDRYSFGARWLVLGVVVALLVPMNIARWRGAFQLTRRIGFIATAAVTLAVITSATLLVNELLHGATNAPTLLADAALIWVANVLIFALWYWEIDAGGPHERARTRYRSIDFLFPQLTLDDKDEHWMPGFVDYLFLAFNTSTAFSPTDTLVLSQRAKLLMMIQSLVSLVVIAVIAARAINTLPG